jgi:hypothetical protein
VSLDPNVSNILLLFALIFSIYVCSQRAFFDHISASSSTWCHPSAVISFDILSLNIRAVSLLAGLKVKFAWLNEPRELLMKLTAGNSRDVVIFLLCVVTMRYVTLSLLYTMHCA